MALDLRPGVMPTLPAARHAPAGPAGIEVHPDRGDRGTRTLPHRPALDGLRGIAVAAVVIYHLEPGLLPGGFLGVSLFFTLSGFLITNLLLAEWRQQGRIDLRAFWARRFRRLLPAALLTLLLVLAVCAGSNDPHLLSNLRGDVLGALAYVANWRFILNGDPYGAGFHEPSPVLHFWSLAIEEQFYVVVAIVAFVLARYARRARTWALTFGAAALGSMLATWWLSSRGSDTARVYFGSDTRAFELLAGVLLAIGAGFTVPSFSRGRWWRHALGPVALGALGAVMLLAGVEQRWLYRGGFWMIAALSVVLIVSALDDGPIARVLTWRPLTALGLISYGVYLFHWPLFAWLTPERLGVDGWAVAGIRIGATLALATGSYLLVEQPIRNGRLPAVRHPALVAGALAATAAILLAGTTWLDGVAARRAVAASTPGLQLNTSLGEGEQLDAGLTGTTLDDETDPPPLERVLILGDSLLHQSYPSIRDRLASLGIDSLAIGGPGQHLMKNDGAWQAELDRAIDAYDPDLVVLESCCGWGSPWQRELYHAPDGRIIEPDTPESWAEWDRLARVLTARARQGGRPVAWVLAPPAQTNGYYGPIETRIDLANDLYRRIARCDPGVGLIDWRVMSGPDGRFVWDLPAADSPVRIRTEDDLHLTPAGQAAVADLTRDGVSGLWQRTRGRIPPAASPACS